MASPWVGVLLSVSGVFVYVNCILYLPEGAPCVSEGKNGTCKDLWKCSSAAHVYIYVEEGGYNRSEFPPMPEVCSYEPKYVVCCTDCEGTTPDDSFRNAVVGPNGNVIKKTGKPAHDNCLDFFQKLRYPCRGQANVQFKMEWDKQKKCHELRIMLALPIGGRDAQPWEFPHMALLGYGDSVGTAQWLCGGSIISERFILTAAHCSSTNALGPIKYAALGLLKRSEPKERWKVYKIKRIIVHPGYASPSKYHDIALLETENEINFGRDLLPACLDIGDTYKWKAEAAGWGRLGHKQPLADNLQVIQLEEYNQTDCSSIYKPHRHLVQGYDHNKQMCYGSRKKIVDTCQGDSGGPLQTNLKECLYTIVGVTSYGKDCGILGNAGMYTRVAHYVTWIESIVWP